MINTLTFSLPEEAVELHCALHAGSMHSALLEIQRTIRDVHKYEATTPADALVAISEIIIDALAWDNA